MAKIIDHRHQPAHDGSISAGFGLLAAIGWLPSPTGLWNPNQVHPVFDMGLFGWSAAVNANIPPLVGLVRRSLLPAAGPVDGAPCCRPNAAHMMTSTCHNLATIDAWFDHTMIDNMKTYQPRRGLITLVPRALSYQMDRVEKRWTLKR